MIFKTRKKPKEKKTTMRVTMKSNVIQYDEMGYPLRLVVVRCDDGTVEHLWLDIDANSVTENDVVLKWEKIDFKDDI